MTPLFLRFTGRPRTTEASELVLDSLEKAPNREWLPGNTSGSVGLSFLFFYNDFIALGTYLFPRFAWPTTVELAMRSKNHAPLAGKPLLDGSGYRPVEGGKAQLRKTRMAIRAGTSGWGPLKWMGTEKSLPKTAAHLSLAEKPRKSSGFLWKLRKRSFRAKPSASGCGRTLRSTWTRISPPR